MQNPGECVQNELDSTENRLRQVLQKLRQTSLQQVFDGETWNRLQRWILWNISLKRRRIKRLTRRLIPLDQNAPPEVRILRDEVFALTCLKLKRMEERHELLELLNSANQPVGFEQIFLSAIYPQILNRNFGLSLLPGTANHRLDVEIGYLGHNEDYFFWLFEIDGVAEDKPGRTLVPEQKIRDDKRYVIYRLGVAGLVEEGNLDALQWIINAQVLFNNVLADLKKRNYKVTAASRPHFERGRLSLLRRLALDELKKRQSRS